MVFTLIVGMALRPMVDIDSQNAAVFHDRKFIIISLLATRAIVIRKILKSPAAALSFGEFAVVFVDADIHPVVVDYCKDDRPGSGGIVDCLNFWIDNRKARSQDNGVAFALKPSLVIIECAVVRPQVLAHRVCSQAPRVERGLSSHKLSVEKMECYS